MKLTLAILGLGRIGKIHCRNALLHHNVDVVAVCDPLLDKNWLKTTSIRNCFAEEGAFWQCDFDAVVICSPTNSHRHHIDTAMRLNKHILCEKPLSQSLADNIALHSALHTYRRNFQIGFNRRFDDDFATIAQGVKNGDLGRPYYLRITSRDPKLPPLDYLKSSGGMFLDMTIHDFDMARFVMGSDITEVYARGDALIDPSLKDIGDVDTAIITIKFANGAFGVIDNSRQAVYGYDQRLEVFGEKGMLANQNHRITQVEKSSSFGTLREPVLHFFLERYEQSYQNELNKFVDSCLTNSPSSPSVDDAVKAVIIADAAHKSLREHRPVVIEHYL